MSEFNHQKGFHYKLSKVIPDYKKRENALQRYISTQESGGVKAEMPNLFKSSFERQDENNPPADDKDKVDRNV